MLMRAESSMPPRRAAAIGDRWLVRCPLAPSAAVPSGGVGFPSPRPAETLVAREEKKTRRAPTRGRLRDYSACEEAGARHRRGVERETKAEEEPRGREEGGRTKRKRRRRRPSCTGKGRQGNYAVVSLPGVARRHQDYHSEEGVEGQSRALARWSAWSSSSALPGKVEDSESFSVDSFICAESWVGRLSGSECPSAHRSALPVSSDHAALAACRHGGTPFRSFSDPWAQRRKGPRIEGGEAVPPLPA